MNKSFSTVFTSFQPLLEEHHFGRLFCWRINQGLKLGVDPQRIARYAEHFWLQSLSAHLQEEEFLLFMDRSDTLIRQAVDDHLFLRTYMGEITGCLNKNTVLPLAQLAGVLDRHIRYEEKILFPHLKNTLNHDLLKNIHLSLAAATLSSAKSGYLYTDEFWKTAGSSL